jgi:two-component system, cell cycle sensor histidine kinase and response regulator CckA
VDDEPTIREIASATLSQYGYRVLVAKDGTEGVALFAKRSRDISAVITDIGMPNLGGASMALVVNRLNPAVKILAMSGLSNTSPDPQVAPFAGAFLVKPFKAEALLETVYKLLHPEDPAGPS